MVTVKELAKMCGVSVSTVSNVLNGQPKVSAETKEKILAAVKETGYTPNYFAQGIRKRNTKTIGIITEELTEIFTTAPIVEAIMDYCESVGYRTILINLRLYARRKDKWYHDEDYIQKHLQTALTEMKSIKVDGICYIGGHCRVIDGFDEDFDIPTVMLYAHSKNPNIPSFLPYDEKGAYECIEYLAKCGHKNIGIIGGEEDNIHTTERMNGAMQAVKELGMNCKPEWIAYSEFTGKGAVDFINKWMEDGVTAVFCMSDLIALTVYEKLAQYGKQVGKELSVIGFDNRNFSRMLSPKLTTVDLPLKPVGDKAIKALFEIISHREGESMFDPGIVVKIPGNFIERDSVAKI